MNFQDMNSQYLFERNNNMLLYPDRWGIVSSIVLDDIELLFQWELDDTLGNAKKNVRWGIPILFPWAWALDWNDQHGFVRNMWFKILSKSSQKIELVLSSNNETKKTFPFDFKLVIIHEVSNTSYRITQIVENTWENSMPISSWLHPYFDIPNENKDDAKIIDKDGNDIELANDGDWKNGRFQIFNAPEGWVFLEIPGTWTIIIETSEDYKIFWIWSQKWKSFVCVEPVMWNPWSIWNISWKWELSAPIVVQPWESNESYMELSLLK